MNITMRKLYLLEKAISEKEESLKDQGYVTNTIDTDLKKQVVDIIQKLPTL